MIELATNYSDFYTQHRTEMLKHIYSVNRLTRRGATMVEASISAHTASTLVDTATKRHALTVQLLDDLEMDTAQDVAIKSLKLSEPDIESGHASFFIHCELG